jgi:hypothetical protein
MSEPTILGVVTAVAEAEVTPGDPNHGAECVAVHPNEPCPGYPHEES